MVASCRLASRKDRDLVRTPRKTSLADLSVQFGQITANQYGSLPIPLCHSENAALAGEYRRRQNQFSGTTYFEGLWIVKTMLCTD